MHITGSNSLEVPLSFFRLTPHSPCFRQRKRFTAEKRSLQHSRVRNNMDLPLLWTIFGFKRFFSSVFDGIVWGTFTKDIYLAAFLCFYFSDSTSFVRNILDWRYPYIMSSCRKMPQIRKSYERFNVGAMMKARRQAKEGAAIGHKSVQQLRKRVDTVAAKKRRLHNRVSYSVHCRFGLWEHLSIFCLI